MRPHHLVTVASILTVAEFFATTTAYGRSMARSVRKREREIRHRSEKGLKTVRRASAVLARSVKARDSIPHPLLRSLVIP